MEEMTRMNSRVDESQDFFKTNVHLTTDKKGKWWRTTPVATKAWHYGAGGADTRACPAPSPGEDEGCRVSLHQVRTSSRHDTFHRARARVELSFPSFLLLWTLLARTCLSGPCISSSFPFRPLGGFSPFRDPIREAIFLCEPLNFYEYVLGVGCGPQVGPFLSRPIMGSIRGEGTPPQTLAVIWRKKRELSLSSGCSRKIKEGDQTPPPPPPPLCRRRDRRLPLPWSRISSVQSTRRRRRRRHRPPPLPPPESCSTFPPPPRTISLFSTPSIFIFPVTLLPASPTISGLSRIPSPFPTAFPSCQKSPTSSFPHFPVFPNRLILTAIPFPLHRHTPSPSTIPCPSPIFPLPHPTRVHFCRRLPPLLSRSHLPPSRSIFQNFLSDHSRLIQLPHDRLSDFSPTIALPPANFSK